MAQEGDAGPEERKLSAQEGKRKIEGGTFKVEKIMKCIYCGKEDHLESACSDKTASRRGEMLMGIAFAVFMAPFFAIGFLIGMVWSSLKAGFDFTWDSWPEVWKMILPKKKEDKDESEESC